MPEQCGSDGAKASMTTDPERMPVIIGVGQINDRPADPLEGLDPPALMIAALRRAEEDAGAKLLGAVESLAPDLLTFWMLPDA